MNRERDDRRERERPRRSRSRSPDRRRSRSRSAERRRRDRSHERERNRDRKPRDRSRSRSPRRTRARSRSRSPPRQRSRSPTRRRSRSPERERDKSKKRQRRSSSSSSSSGSDSNRGHRRRSRSRERKDKKREHRDKKDKKSKSKSKSKKKKKGTVASEWGKFGLINESHLYTKDPEFRTWLLEERKINPETISKDQTRKQFAKFVEDFNTGTLPHEKYYNLARYEARMSLVRSGEALPPADEGYDFGADVAAHASAIKRTTRDRETDASYSKEELQELRRVQNERVQLGKMKVLGMDIKTSMGVRMVDNDAFDGD